MQFSHVKLIQIVVQRPIASGAWCSYFSVQLHFGNICVSISHLYITNSRLTIIDDVFAWWLAGWRTCSTAISAWQRDIVLTNHILLRLIKWTLFFLWMPLVSAQWFFSPRKGTNFVTLPRMGPFPSKLMHSSPSLKTGRQTSLTLVFCKLIIYTTLSWVPKLVQATPTPP